MSELTETKRMALETAIYNGNATAVKSLTNSVKEVPPFLRSLARSSLSEHILLGESEDQLQPREEIEKLLSKKQSFKNKLTNFFGLQGGRRTRRKRKPSRIRKSFSHKKV